VSIHSKSSAASTGIQKKFGVGVKKGSVDWIDNVRKIPAMAVASHTPQGLKI
jgi:hypothetical protein